MSRLRLSGTLHGVKKLQNMLEAFPSLRQLSYGTALRYLIDEPDAQSKFYIAEFAKDFIAVEIYSRKAPTILMKEGMLRLLSLASFTSSVYEFDIKSIFPYLIDLLAIEKTSYLPGTIKAVEIHGPELVLSKRILQLKGENQLLREKEASMGRTMTNIAAMLLRTNYRGVCRVSSISSETGLGEDDVRSALKHACLSGGSISWRSKDEFSISW